MRYLIAVLLVVCLASTAEAGRRCSRTFQTLQSNYGWSQNCLSCHKPHAIPHPNASSKATGGWMEALAVLEQKKAEFAAFNKAMNKVGGEAYSQGQGGYSYSGEYTFAPQGSTYYGYNAYNSAPAVTPANMTAIYDMYGKLVTQAQTLAGQAAIDASMLIAQEGANQTEVAKILAQGHVVGEAFKAVQGNPVPVPQLQSFKFNVNQNGEITVERVPQESPDTNDGAAVRPLGEVDEITLQSVQEGKCVSCHSGEEPKGGLDIVAAMGWQGNKYLEFREKMLTRINHPDPEKRMPPPPADPLSWQERVPFYTEGISP